MPFGVAKSLDGKAPLFGHPEATGGFPKAAIPNLQGGRLEWGGKRTGGFWEYESCRTLS